jgi:hypothetical protein
MPRYPIHARQRRSSAAKTTHSLHLCRPREKMAVQECPLPLNRSKRPSPRPTSDCGSPTRYPHLCSCGTTVPMRARPGVQTRPARAKAPRAPPAHRTPLMDVAQKKRAPAPQCHRKTARPAQWLSPRWQRLSASVIRHLLRTLPGSEKTPLLCRSLSSADRVCWCRSW